MKTDEDGDGRKRRQTHSGDERSGSSLTADDTSEWRRRNLTLLLSCDPLTPEPMKDAAVSAAPGPVVEPPQSSRSWTCFQENEWLRSVDSPLRLCQLVCRRLTTNLSAVRPKLNDVLSSSFLTVLCVLSIYFSLFRKSSTYLTGLSYQTNS